MIRRSPAVSQLQREGDVTVSSKQQVSFRPRIMRDPSMLYNMRKYLVTFRFPVIETNARWLGSLKSSRSLGYIASRQFIGVTSVIRSRFNKPAAMGELNATKLDTRISSALLFRSFSLPLKKFNTLDDSIIESQLLTDKTRRYLVQKDCQARIARVTNSTRKCTQSVRG